LVEEVIQSERNWLVPLRRLVTGKPGLQSQNVGERVSRLGRGPRKSFKRRISIHSSLSIASEKFLSRRIKALRIQAVHDRRVPAARRDVEGVDQPTVHFIGVALLVGSWAWWCLPVSAMFAPALGSIFVDECWCLLWWDPASALLAKLSAAIASVIRRDKDHSFRQVVLLENES
jgi:hypothetical protein